MDIYLNIDFTFIHQGPYSHVEPVESPPCTPLIDPRHPVLRLRRLCRTHQNPTSKFPRPISPFPVAAVPADGAGAQGGFALAQSGLTAQVATGLGLAVALAVVVPVAATCC